MNRFESITERVRQVVPFALTGRVHKIVGLTAAVVDLPAPLESVCRIHREDGASVDGEVIGFQGAETLVLPYGGLAGVRLGDVVSLRRTVPTVAAGDSLLGRVLDGRGRPIDNLPPPAAAVRVGLHAAHTPPLDRPPISEPLETGIRAIDAFLTCGRGQRLGIFSGSGLGKSTLLAQLARSSTADVNVIVLVGERGREVREFIERDLGPEALARSVVVAATSDESPLLRVRAAHRGAALAEYFRDEGRDVLLLMDSITRVARALAQIGLAAGEPPANRGFPPSVFAALPQLLERSGRTARGSITGFYTVLVEGDAEHDPIAESARAILDGHLVLSSELAHKAHWPAIDIPQSISRSMNNVVDDEHLQAAAMLRRTIAARRQADDLVSVGAYLAGADPLVDAAIRLESEIDSLLQQDATECTPFAETSRRLQDLARAVMSNEPESVNKAA